MSDIKRQSGKHRGAKAALLSGLAAIILLAMLPLTAAAQDAPTSTPDAEGAIRVAVQPDDSLWSIAARAGLTIPELLALNDLTEDVVLRPGDLLIVGQGAPPVTPTPAVPTATLPPPTATATVEKPRTAVCILAYDDRNRDGMYDAAESLRADVAFTVFNETAVVANYVTDGVSEPHCLEGLAPGVYHVTRSLLRDETLTTEGDWALNLAAGSVLNLAFGSYRGSSSAVAMTPDHEQQLQTRMALGPAATPTAVPPAAARQGSASRLLLLAVAGFVLLLSAAVLTLLFASRRNERS
jgi:hypothetical protein